MGFKHSFKMDLSVLKKLQRNAKKFGKTEIEWGWINGRAYHKGDINKRGGIPYALVAIRNEFGGYTMNMKTNKYVYIPARPYFQQSTPMSVASAKGSVAQVYLMVLTGGDYKSHLKAISNDQVDILKASIARNNMRPLHPKTVAIKDSTKQWDDTGQLIKNITGRVVYKRADFKGA